MLFYRQQIKVLLCQIRCDRWLLAGELPEQRHAIIVILRLLVYHCINLCRFEFHPF